MTIALKPYRERRQGTMKYRDLIQFEPIETVAVLIPRHSSTSGPQAVRAL